MSAIDLYQVLKKIPAVTDDEAKQAAAAVDLTDRMHQIETKLAEVQITLRIVLGLLLTILAILLAPLFQ